MAEHDNPGGPCSCGAWHDKSENGDIDFRLESNGSISIISKGEDEETSWHWEINIPKCDVHRLCNLMGWGPIK